MFGRKANSVIDANGNKIRVTKNIVIERLRMFLNDPDGELVYFDDTSFNQAKHCCQNQAGVKLLNIQEFIFEDEEGNIKVPYFLCTECGKILVYREFM